MNKFKLNDTVFVLYGKKIEACRVLAVSTHQEIDTRTRQTKSQVTYRLQIGDQEPDKYDPEFNESDVFATRDELIQGL